MIKYFFKKIFIPFQYIRNKTRFWRRKRHALERKLTDLDLTNTPVVFLKTLSQFLGSTYNEINNEKRI